MPVPDLKVLNQSQNQTFSENFSNFQNESNHGVKDQKTQFAKVTNEAYRLKLKIKKQNVLLKDLETQFTRLKNEFKSTSWNNLRKALEANIQWEGATALIRCFAWVTLNEKVGAAWSELEANLNSQQQIQLSWQGVLKRLFYDQNAFLNKLKIKSQNFQGQYGHDDYLPGLLFMVSETFDDVENRNLLKQQTGPQTGVFDLCDRLYKWLQIYGELCFDTEAQDLNLQLRDKERELIQLRESQEKQQTKIQSHNCVRNLHPTTSSPFVSHTSSSNLNHVPSQGNLLNKPAQGHGSQVQTTSKLRDILSATDGPNQQLTTSHSELPGPLIDTSYNSQLHQVEVQNINSQNSAAVQNQNESSIIQISSNPNRNLDTQMNSTITDSAPTGTISQSIQTQNSNNFRQINSPMLTNQDGSKVGLQKVNLGRVVPNLDGAPGTRSNTKTFQTAPETNSIIASPLENRQNNFGSGEKNVNLNQKPFQMNQNQNLNKQLFQINLRPNQNLSQSHLNLNFLNLVPRNFGVTSISGSEYFKKNDTTSNTLQGSTVTQSISQTSSKSTNQNNNLANLGPGFNLGQSYTLCQTDSSSSQGDSQSTGICTNTAVASTVASKSSVTVIDDISNIKKNQQQPADGKLQINQSHESYHNRIQRKQDGHSDSQVIQSESNAKLLATQKSPLSISIKEDLNEPPKANSGPFKNKTQTTTSRTMNIAQLSKPTQSSSSRKNAVAQQTQALNQSQTQIQQQPSVVQNAFTSSQKTSQNESFIMKQKSPNVQLNKGTVLSGSTVTTSIGPPRGLHSSLSAKNLSSDYAQQQTTVTSNIARRIRENSERLAQPKVLVSNITLRTTGSAVPPPVTSYKIQNQSQQKSLLNRNLPGATQSVQHLGRLSPAAPLNQNLRLSGTSPAPMMRGQGPANMNKPFVTDTMRRSEFNRCGSEKTLHTIRHMSPTIKRPIQNQMGKKTQKPPPQVNNINNNKRFTSPHPMAEDGSRKFATKTINRNENRRAIPPPVMQPHRTLIGCNNNHTSGGAIIQTADTVNHNLIIESDETQSQSLQVLNEESNTDSILESDQACVTVSVGTPALNSNDTSSVQIQHSAKVVGPQSTIRYNSKEQSVTGATGAARKSYHQKQQQLQLQSTSSSASKEPKQWQLKRLQDQRTKNDLGGSQSQSKLVTNSRLLKSSSNSNLNVNLSRPVLSQSNKISTNENFKILKKIPSMKNTKSKVIEELNLEDITEISNLIDVNEPGPAVESQNLIDASDSHNIIVTGNQIIEKNDLVSAKVAIQQQNANDQQSDNHHSSDNINQNLQLLFDQNHQSEHQISKESQLSFSEHLDMDYPFANLLQNTENLDGHEDLSDDDYIPYECLPRRRIESFLYERLVQSATKIVRMANGQEEEEEEEDEAEKEKEICNHVNMGVKRNFGGGGTGGGFNYKPNVRL